MPKLPNSYTAYARNVRAVGGPMSLATAHTDPVYSTPFYLADREQIHALFDIYRAATSPLTTLYIRMVFHYDINATATEWYSKVDPYQYVRYDVTGSKMVIDQAGIIDRQAVTLEQSLKATFPLTERFSLVFKTGDAGSRLPFARFEITTKEDPNDGDLWSIYLPGGGDHGEPPATGDPGSGQGDDLDP